MEAHILKLYALWQDVGTERFCAAIQACHNFDVYGADYVQLLIRNPAMTETDVGKPDPTASSPKHVQPTQQQAATPKEVAAFPWAEQPNQETMPNRGHI